MDIYTEVQSGNHSKLIESPFGGRYCGPIPPRKRVSLYHGIALSYYTDKNVTLPDLFTGYYNFINECKKDFHSYVDYQLPTYYVLIDYILISAEYEVGTPAPSTPCTFTVDAAIKRTGNILSPTYPGAYPKDLVCSYQFIGQPSQRVRLEFRDFDLFFGGPQ